MNNILGIADVRNYIWLIPLMFSIHEVEEWNILKWYKKYYRNLPASTNTSIRIHIVALSLLSFLLTLLAYWASVTFLFSLIVIFLSVFILQNFLQHVIWTFQLKAYSPGLTTGLLCVFVTAYVNSLLIQNNLLILPFYFMALLAVPSLIGTMKVKGEMTNEVRKVHFFFIKMEKALTGILQKHGE